MKRVNKTDFFIVNLNIKAMLLDIEDLIVKRLDSTHQGFLQPISAKKKVVTVDLSQVRSKRQVQWILQFQSLDELDLDRLTQSGSSSALEYLRSVLQCPFYASTSLSAIRAGRLNLYYWLEKQGCSPSGEHYVAAATLGNWELMCHIRDMGMTHDIHTIARALKHVVMAGHEHIFMQAEFEGYYRQPGIVYNLLSPCGSYGRIGMLEHLHNLNSRFNMLLVRSIESGACSRNQLVVLQWLHEHGYQISINASYSLQPSASQLIYWVYEHQKQPLSPDLYCYAVKVGDCKLLQWLYDHKCPYAPKSIESIPNVEVLRWLSTHNFSIDRSVRINNVEVFRELLSMGHTFYVTPLGPAMQLGDVAFMNEVYALTMNNPEWGDILHYDEGWDLQSAIQTNNTAMVKWAIDHELNFAKTDVYVNCIDIRGFNLEMAQYLEELISTNAIELSSYYENDEYFVDCCLSTYKSLDLGNSQLKSNVHLINALKWAHTHNYKFAEDHFTNAAKYNCYDFFKFALDHNIHFDKEECRELLPEVADPRLVRLLSS